MTKKVKTPLGNVQETLWLATAALTIGVGFGVADLVHTHPLFLEAAVIFPIAGVLDAEQADRKCHGAIFALVIVAWAYVSHATFKLHQFRRRENAAQRPADAPEKVVCE